MHGRTSPDARKDSLEATWAGGKGFGPRRGHVRANDDRRLLTRARGLKCHAAFGYQNSFLQFEVTQVYPRYPRRKRAEAAMTAGIQGNLRS